MCIRDRYGTRLEVVVRDAVEPPELAGEDGYYDIVAETDGLIAQVEPMAGEAAVQEGDTVAEGEVLISGLITMEPPKYSDLPVSYTHLAEHEHIVAQRLDLQIVVPRGDALELLPVLAVHHRLEQFPCLTG